MLTLFICMAQSAAYLTTISADAIVINGLFFRISSMIMLTAGTVFCMWLGEKITDKGIGNGISMLIMIGIIPDFLQILWQKLMSRGMSQMLFFFIELLALFFVVMATVALVQAIRRIQYNMLSKLSVIKFMAVSGNIYLESQQFWGYAHYIRPIFNVFTRNDWWYLGRNNDTAQCSGGNIFKS